MSPYFLYENWNGKIILDWFLKEIGELLIWTPPKIESSEKAMKSFTSFSSHTM